jgi:hypothetical protein
MSIEVEKSGTLLPGLLFGGSLELSQLGGPEIVEEVADRGQSVCANHEEMAGSLALLGHESRGSQDLQVVGDDLL